jgi:serine/threonine protein kinase/uncharacterized protein YjgD (DUF1641 family)
MSSSAQSDRNLLFGILALQLDFISRDQLVAGMNAWVLAKHQPLGAILCAQGALAGDSQALLEALVQKHLRQHHDDLQQSLAALSPVPSVRHELEQLADPDVHASVAHVSDARPQEADSYATRSFTVGTPTSSGLRFRILRPHAKGGLGQVSVALDEELHREVALKEIQERHADDANSRGRFLLEAEITGGLEHPGIVPVYGLGCYADGRPFYAMRFIRGDSLKDAIARFHASDPSGGRKPPEPDSGGLRPPLSPPLGERTLAFRKLLGRFVDVCNAIAYAHSRGVLHRDLKPGNVMLGQYGETLVVDWGLAKVRDKHEASLSTEEPVLRPASASGSAATQLGTTLGTPAYMSPEQAAGWLDQLGPASDVYSLGATLYCLLTGQAPFRESGTGRLLERVQKGEFARPRQVQPETPPALEAVCLKAMALRPGDRYASPRALADDIEHWLAGEPVGAWPEPWTVTTARWVSRHRTLVSGAAAALLVGLVSLLIATGLLSAANEELAQERDKVQQTNAELQTRNVQLAAARDKANQARKRAVKSEQLALANEKKALAAAKAESEARQAEAAQRQQAEIAAKAERKAKEAEAAQRQQAETVSDLLQEVFLKLDPPAEQKGLSLKEQLIAQVDAVAARLDKEFGDQPLVQARLRNALGLAQQGLGQTSKAMVLFQQALAQRRAHLPADHPDTLTSMNNLASAYQEAGQLDKALPLYEEALAKTKAKLGPDHRLTLSSMNNLGNAYRIAGQLTRAVPLLEKTLAQSKAGLGPDDPLILAAMNNLAAAYQAAGQPDKALPLYEETLVKCKTKLGPDHPLTLTSMNNLAVAYQAAGQLKRALPFLKQTLAKRKAKLGPHHPDTLQSMNNLANAYQAAGQLDKALPLYEEALAKSKAKLSPDHPLTLTSMNNLAAAYQAAGQLKRALPLFKQTLAKQMATLGPHHPDTLLSMNNLANAYQAAGQLDKALPLFEEALAKSKAKLGPDHPLTLTSMNNLAMAYYADGQLARALPLLEETLAKTKAKLGPEHPNTLRIMSNLAEVYYTAGQPDRALPLFEETLAKQKAKLGSDHPATLTGMHNLAMAYKATGQLDKALPLLEETLVKKKAKLGPEHPETLKTMAALALAYLAVKEPEKALPLFRSYLAAQKKHLGRDNPRLANRQSVVAVELLKAGQSAAAEPILRASLAIRQKQLPASWETFQVQSLLGAALLDQKKYKEAEPMLLQGYEGMKERQAQIPLADRPRLTETLQRLVQLYEATGQAEQADRWRKERERTQGRGDKDAKGR